MDSYPVKSNPQGQYFPAGSFFIKNKFQKNEKNLKIPLDFFRNMRYNITRRHGEVF